MWGCWLVSSMNGDSFVDEWTGIRLRVASPPSE
jgi:hypothetical protein